MSFYLFLIVIVSLSCGSAPAVLPISGNSVFASVALVSAWVMLTHVAARVLANQYLRGRMSMGEASRLLELQLSAFRWLALPVVVVCLSVFSLAAWSAEQAWLGGSMAAQSLVLLTPGLAILISTWSAEYHFAARVGWIDGSARRYLRSMADAFRGGPAWLVLPTICLLLVGDGVTKLATTSIANSPLFFWGLIGCGAAAVIALIPVLVAGVIRTQPMDPAARLRIETWLQRSGIATSGWRAIRILRWDTNGTALNALVAGVFAPGRLLLLSDRVLDELPTDQLQMVVLHEVAHVKRFHVPLRMAAIAPAWAVAAMVGVAMEDWAWAAVVSGVVGMAATMLALGAVAYWTELDADAVACRLAKSETAGNSLAQALDHVTRGQPAARRASWLHPSLAMRVNRLQSDAPAGSIGAASFSESSYAARSNVKSNAACSSSVTSPSS